MALTPDGHYAYATWQGGTFDRGLAIINTITKTLDTVSTFYGPSVLLITPDARYAYVAHWASGLRIFDTLANQFVDWALGSFTPDALAITPDGTRLYVANAHDHYLSVVDTTLNADFGRIMLPAGSKPIDLAMTRDGNYLYVANSGETWSPGNITVIDTNSGTVVESFVPGGDHPSGIAITPWPKTLSC